MIVDQGLLLPKPKLERGFATPTKQTQQHPTSFLPPIQVNPEVFFCSFLFPLPLTDSLDGRLLCLFTQRRRPFKRRRKPVAGPNSPYCWPFQCHSQKADGLRRVCQPSQPGPQKECEEGFPVHCHGCWYVVATSPHACDVYLTQFHLQASLV